MAQTIDDFICNLLAGRKKITDLYYAWERACDAYSEVRLFCFTFSYPGLGSKQYDGHKLRKLECESRQFTYEELCEDVKDIDNIVRLLFKARKPLLK